MDTEVEPGKRGGSNGGSGGAILSCKPPLRAAASVSKSGWFKSKRETVGPVLLSMNAVRPKGNVVGIDTAAPPLTAVRCALSSGNGSTGVNFTVGTVTVDGMPSVGGDGIGGNGPTGGGGSTVSIGSHEISETVKSETTLPCAAIASFSATTSEGTLGSHDTPS